jgi:lysozyme
MDNKVFFDFLRRKKALWSGKPKAKLTQEEVDEANRVLDPTQTPIIVTGTRIPTTETIGSKKGALATIVGTIAATTLLSVVPQFEGTKYEAYKDIAGIWTVCQGDTKDVHAGLIETPEGCRKRLELQLAAHTKGMMLCTPALNGEGLDYLKAAGGSLSYNIGISAYCHSSVDKNWDVGKWLDGCNSFMVWNKAKVKGVLRPVESLTTRRKMEIQICGTNLVPGWTPQNLQTRMKGVTK